MSEQLTTPNLEQQLSSLAGEVDELLAIIEPVTDALQNTNTFAAVTDARNNTYVIGKSVQPDSLPTYRIACIAPVDTEGYIVSSEYKWGVDTPSVLYAEVHESREFSSSVHPDDLSESRELDSEDVTGPMRIILDSYATCRNA